MSLAQLHTDIIRTMWMEHAWAVLCQGQSFLEAHQGKLGIEPPHYFAWWRLSFERAWYGDEPWKGPPALPPVVGI